MAKRLISLSAVLLVLVVLGRFFAKPLWAQVRAALTSSIDDPGRIAYQSVVSNQCPRSTVCTFQFGSPPPGHRVVIQRISGILSANSNPSFFRVVLEAPDAPFLAQFSPPISASSTAGAFSSFNEPVQGYFDPGETIEVFLGTDGLFIGQDTVTLSGYELDCSAAPCSPIAH